MILLQSRALQNFTVGRKNWIIINTIYGVQASSTIYSITETAKTNELKVYSSIKYLLEDLIELPAEQENIKQSSQVSAPY